MKSNYKVLLAVLCIATIPYAYYVYKTRKPAPYVEQIPAYQMSESNPAQVQKIIANLKNQRAPFSVQQSIELISMLYNELGPRMGSHLLEPNALLTLAGFRGRGNFITHYLTQEEKERFERINNELNDIGIQFDLYDDIADELVDVYIRNLKGLEYASGLSKLPFVKKFNASEMSYLEWWKSTSEAAKKYFQSPEAMMPFSEEGISHVLIGLGFGYPDQALIDIYSSYALENRPYSSFIDSEIRDSNYYDNPQPNFSFSPEHKNDPGIVNIIKTWGSFLEHFYQRPWQQKLESDPGFIQMRELEEAMHNRWFKRKRMNQ